MKDTIENKNGRFVSATGKGVDAFRLRALIVGLKFRQKTGFDMDRRVKTLKIAKAETGLKTNDIDRLISALVDKMNAVISECHVITD